MSMFNHKSAQKANETRLQLYEGELSKLTKAATKQHMADTKDVSARFRRMGREGSRARSDPNFKRAKREGMTFRRWIRLYTDIKPDLPDYILRGSINGCSKSWRTKARNWMRSVGVRF